MYIGHRHPCRRRCWPVAVPQAMDDERDVVESVAPSVQAGAAGTRAGSAVVLLANAAHAYLVHHDSLAAARNARLRVESAKSVANRRVAGVLEADKWKRPNRSLG